MIDIYRLLDRDVVSTKLRFSCKLPARHHVRSIICASLVVAIINPQFVYTASSQSEKMPVWRTDNIWQYNVTIDGIPGNHKATVLVTGWGKYLDANGTEFEAYDVLYSVNSKYTNTTGGNLTIRDTDARKITRQSYETAFSQRKVVYNFTGAGENRTVWLYTDYHPMINTFDFPLNIGDAWHQKIQYNTTREVESPSGDITLSEIEIDTYSLYFRCVGYESVTLNLTDSKAYHLFPEASNWSLEVFSGLKVIQDFEEHDTDGTFIVYFFNATMGNIIRREEWEAGTLNLTWSLVFTDFEYSDEPFVPPNPPEEESPELMVCIGGLVIMAVLIITFVVIRRRSVSHEDRFTKEYIEGVETKTELIELCEEAKLSAKGAKGQLRKRLLLYVEELEKEKKESKRVNEDFEDEGSEASEEGLEKEMDELDLEEEMGDDAGEDLKDAED